MAAVDDAASVLLLRALRSGAVDVDCSFVHRIDVCSAAPEDLVANLQPVPGTDLAEDGYSSVWYFYCPKRFKNAQGKPSGHRQRAIAGGETCWHSEAGPKPVKGVDGATHCNLSFGRKEGSSRSFNRMGWCMTEYDDKNNGGGDHVLCKVHRSSSSLAKGKSKLATKNSSGCKKRKATDDHPQAPPMKMSLPAPVDDQVYHQVLPPLLTCHQMMTMPDYVDYESLFLDEEEQLQHTTLFQVEKEQPQQITMIPAEEQQLQQYTFLPPDEEQQLQQDTFFPVEQQQLEQNTFFPGEEQQPIEQAMDDHPQAPPTKICASVDELQVDRHEIDYESQLSIVFKSLFPDEEEQIQQNTWYPPEQQQQLQQNALFPVEQQLEQNISLPAEEQQPEQNIFFPPEQQQLDPNTLFTMEELLRSPGYDEYGACLPNRNYTMDDLFNGCSGRCDTPKAMGAPDGVFFEGLGLAF